MRVSVVYRKTCFWKYGQCNIATCYTNDQCNSHLCVVVYAIRWKRSYVFYLDTVLLWHESVKAMKKSYALPAKSMANDTTRIQLHSIPSQGLIQHTCTAHNTFKCYDSDVSLFDLLFEVILRVQPQITYTYTYMHT